MKYWQYFFLMAAVYIAPHISEWVAISIGGIFASVGFFAKWRDE